MADDIDFDFFDSPGQREDHEETKFSSQQSYTSVSHEGKLILQAKIPTPSNTISDTESSSSSNDDDGQMKESSQSRSRHSRISRKPPRHQMARRKSGHNVRNSNQTAKDGDKSISLVAPGSTYYTPDGRKMKKGRCTYSDEELTQSSSDDEEIRISYNSDRSRGNTPRYSGEDSARSTHSPRPYSSLHRHTRRSRSRSNSNTSRSRSRSSQWSTGSEREDVKKTPQRKPTRNSHRRSDSGSSISVSSLSDSEQPASESHVIMDGTANKVDKDQINLKLLLSALLDADDDDTAAVAEYSRCSNTEKHVTLKSPSISESRSAAKNNYSFTSDRAKMIDMENQRLLNRASSAISFQPNSKSSTVEANKVRTKKSTQKEAPVRMTPATLNRMREQQRIERENLAMLRRLNQVKPSADVNRTKQLDDYHRQISYYCPQLRGENKQESLSAAINPHRSKSSQAFSSTTNGGTGRRSRPASAGQTRPSSAYSNTSTGKRRPNSASTSRPLSATSIRPKSATNSKRPEWQSGW